MLKSVDSDRTFIDKLIRENTAAGVGKRLNLMRQVVESNRACCSNFHCSEKISCTTFYICIMVGWGR